MEIIPKFLFLLTLFYIENIYIYINIRVKFSEKIINYNIK